MASRIPRASSAAKKAAKQALILERKRLKMEAEHEIERRKADAQEAREVRAVAHKLEKEKCLYASVSDKISRAIDNGEQSLSFSINSWNADIWDGNTARAGAELAGERIARKLRKKGYTARVEVHKSSHDWEQIDIGCSGTDYYTSVNLEVGWSKRPVKKSSHCGKKMS